MRLPRCARSDALSLVLTACAACAGPRLDLDAWRAREAAAAPAAIVASDAGATLATIERERASGELAAARSRALALVAARPEDGPALLAASRAESDAMLLFADEGNESSRDHAAASARDYAERAVAAGERSA